MGVSSASFPAARNRNEMVRWENVSAQGEYLAADSTDLAVIANTKAKYQVVVRKITVNIYTVAAQGIEFRSDGAGGDPVFNIAASAVIGAHTIDYGEIGYALPAGEGLEVDVAGAGPAFTFVVEAWKRTIAGPMIPSQM